MKTLLAFPVSAVWLITIGCAEEKATPAPSQRAMPSHSGRFFDKMNQDEHHYTKDENKSLDGGHLPLLLAAFPPGQDVG